LLLRPSFLPANQKTRRESRKKAPDFSSMIEVHLDPTATIEFISFDPIGVLVDQKAREAGDGLFIREQRVFGWSPVGKLYQLTIVANVHIEIEFVKADFGLGISFHKTQDCRGLDKFIQRSRRSHDYVPSRSPDTALGLHELENFLRAADTGI